MNSTAAEAFVLDDELEDQELTEEQRRERAMPSFHHSAIQINLGLELAKNREFRVCGALSLELNGQPVIPDLSLYPREPLDLLHDIVRRSDPPFCVVEIISPRQGSQDVMDKLDLYFSAGVKSVWIVVPPFRLVTIFTPDGEQQTLHSGVLRDPVIGVTADLDAVFS